ncbi:hypothetical protein ACIGO6_40025 [Streptomyces sp. NPDC053750]|uniref:hypothetical protein n=1 Tax=Streptomyces sp. NPDC053750 TaxID=3365714 RepID=UPI0037D7AC58
MIDTLIAAFSSIVALGALVVSFIAHRHQVVRAAALDLREERVEAREQTLERREQRIQASMIEIRVTSSQSSLHDGWVTPRLEIVNPSNQPITALNASDRGEAVGGVSGSVSSGTTRSFPLLPSESGVLPHQVTITFTDAAGTRWRRDGGGGLQRGVRTANGGWDWRDREEPVITESRANDYLPAPPPSAAWSALAESDESRSGRRRLRLGALAALVVAAIVATTLVHIHR